MSSSNINIDILFNNMNQNIIKETPSEISSNLLTKSKTSKAQLIKIDSKPKISPLKLENDSNFNENDFRSSLIDLQIKKQPTHDEYAVFVHDNHPIQIGDVLKLNHYKGVVVRIISEVKVKDKLTGIIYDIPLKSSLYEIRVDTSQKLEWVTQSRQVWCPENTILIRLFRDEFEWLETPEN